MPHGKWTLEVHFGKGVRRSFPATAKKMRPLFAPFCKRRLEAGAAGRRPAPRTSDNEPPSELRSDDVLCNGLLLRNGVAVLCNAG
jgi:hypothetical protein